MAASRRYSRILERQLLGRLLTSRFYFSAIQFGRQQLGGLLTVCFWKLDREN